MGGYFYKNVDVEVELDEDDIIDYLKDCKPEEVKEILEAADHTKEIENVDDGTLYDEYFYEHFLKVKEEYTLQQFEEMMPVKR